MQGVVNKFSFTGRKLVTNNYKILLPFSLINPKKWIRLVIIVQPILRLVVRSFLLMPPPIFFQVFLTGIAQSVSTSFFHLTSIILEQWKKQQHFQQQQEWQQQQVWQQQRRVIHFPEKTGALLISIRIWPVACTINKLQL